MRFAILLSLAAILGLGACNLTGPESGPGPAAVGPGEEPRLVPIVLDKPGTEPPGHKPPEPAALPDQPLEVVVEGAPELSGRFWAWDAVCLPPGGRATVKSLRPGCAPALVDPGAWRKAGGATAPSGDDALTLTVPRTPGAKHRLELRGSKSVAFNVVVLTEARVERDRRSGAWRVHVEKELIGTYPDPGESKSRLVREHRALYEPPRFFMHLDAAAEKLPLAPHLLAGQMVGFIEVNRVKTKRRHTLWFPPNRPLIEKIERLSLELAAGGVRFKRLVINSGFRTPVHNAAVGGGGYSRHMYGDAADVMVDEDDDDRMDDLNRDGVSDSRDALVIAQALRKLELAGRVRPGGIGAYGYDTPESCAAFVHLDARGFITRWGVNYKRGRSQALNWWPPEEFKEEEGD